MRNLMILALVLAALPAWAIDPGPMWGVWKVIAPTDPSYSGVMMVDRESRVTWNAAWDPEHRIKLGMPPGLGYAKSVGYIEPKSGGYDVVITNGNVVERLHCVVQSAVAMACSNLKMTRTAMGPESLITPSR